MARFNFTNILPTSRANIQDVMNNFNKIEEFGITSEEVNNALQDYTKTIDLGALATKNYSVGTAAPSGGNDGDVYDQYFN